METAGNKRFMEEWMRMKIRSPTKDKRESFTTEYGTDKPGAFQYGSFLSEG
jgi:hypothetical protein